MVTLLRGKAFVIISLEFYTKLTLHWFIYAVSFIKLFRGQTSLLILILILIYSCSYGLQWAP